MKLVSNSDSLSLNPTILKAQKTKKIAGNKARATMFAIVALLSFIAPVIIQRIYLGVLKNSPEFLVHNLIDHTKSGDGKGFL
jgi:hypothetical protein